MMQLVILSTLILCPLILSKRPSTDRLNCKLMDYNGYLQYVCIRASGRTFFRCAYSEVYYRTDLNNMCPNDERFYQMCGIPRDDVPTIQAQRSTLCGDFVCANTYSATYRPGSYDLINMCNGKADCHNTDADEAGCPAEETGEVVLRSGRKINKMQICDGYCSVLHLCEDEALCNGFMYGIYCKSSSNDNHYSSPNEWCGYYDSRCLKKEDTKLCTVNNATNQLATCETYVKMIGISLIQRSRIALSNYSRCGITPTYVENPMMPSNREPLPTTLCVNHLDQTNCSDIDRVGLICRINTYISTVAHTMVCTSFEYKQQICDDGMENVCVAASAVCFLHKHKLCDGINDCQDESDEKSDTCTPMTSEKCLRKGNHKGGPLNIPIAWLYDNVEDCLSGKDEVGTRPTCGEGVTARVYDGKECEDVYICREGYAGYVRYDQLCDGVESCGAENTVCRVSRDFPDTVIEIDQYGGSKNAAFCVPGMSYFEQLKGDPCDTVTFQFPSNHIILGVSSSELTRVRLPTVPTSCDHVFGELYLYLSCTGSCQSSCPLVRIPKIDSCNSQSDLRKIGTVAHDETGKDYLTFVTKVKESFHNNYFVCEKTKKCLPYSKVCDLINDCGDMSDEASCTNHFKCVSQDHYIPRSQKCDGSFHCLDLTDECNEECSKQILDGFAFELMALLFGVAAVLLNLINIFKGIFEIRECTQIRALSNKCMVLLIGIGDLFIGIYLSILFAFDAYYGNDFCSIQPQWLSSTGCSLLGVLSTTGSFISIFAMNWLSVLRLFGIKHSLVRSAAINRNNAARLFLTCFLIVFVSVALSVIPILSVFEDFFVNGLTYDPALKLFIGFPDKMKHFEIIQAYNGRVKFRSMSWKLIRSMTEEMFSKEYGGLSHRYKKIDFYGNDAVCFFKFFVTPSDPQVYFVWSVVAIYFLCLLNIAVCYFSIATISQQVGVSVGERFKRRNQRTQRKIKLLILTDWLCWFPFIVICLLHSSEVLDATKWYSVFSIIVLPINSVTNPLLYDNIFFVIAKKIKDSFLAVKQKHDVKNPVRVTRKFLGSSKIPFLKHRITSIGKGERGFNLVEVVPSSGTSQSVKTVGNTPQLELEEMKTEERCKSGPPSSNTRSGGIIVELPGKKGGKLLSCGKSAENCKSARIGKMISKTLKTNHDSCITIKMDGYLIMMMPSRDHESGGKKCRDMLGVETGSLVKSGSREAKHLISNVRARLMLNCRTKRQFQVLQKPK